MQYQLGNHLLFFNKYFSFFGKFFRILNRIKDVEVKEFSRPPPLNPLTAQDFFSIERESEELSHRALSQKAPALVHNVNLAARVTRQEGR